MSAHPATAGTTSKIDAIHACRELTDAAECSARAAEKIPELPGKRDPAREDWSQLDQWADEGGAIVPPPSPHPGS